MEKTKNSKKFWIALVIFSLVGQVAWVVEMVTFKQDTTPNNQFFHAENAIVGLEFSQPKLL